MIWNKFKKKKEKQFKCSTCGKIHEELPSIGFKTPFYYDILSEDDKNTIAEISDDFCVINHPEQTDRFIRTVLNLKTDNPSEDLVYEIWVSVSENNFNEYKSNFKNQTDKKIYFGTICNEIADYEESTVGLHVNVSTRIDELRPELIPHKSEHRLVSEWENGITFHEANSRIEKIL
ncbi:MAG: DUF2199 domain-containing protein [Bacteroidota bacterium]